MSCLSIAHFFSTSFLLKYSESIMSNTYRPTALATDNFRIISELMGRLSLLRFSGRLDLYSSTKKTTWNIFFSAGRILYATDGWHSAMRLSVHLKRYSSQLERKPLSPLEISQRKHPEFRALCIMVHEGQVQIEQARSVLCTILEEILLDAALSQGLTYTLDKLDLFRDPMCAISCEEAVEMLKKALQQWSTRSSVPVSLEASQPTITQPAVVAATPTRSGPSTSFLQNLVGFLRNKR
jgi:hypothetical protein